MSAPQTTLAHEVVDCAKPNGDAAAAEATLRPLLASWSGPEVTSDVGRWSKQLVWLAQRYGTEPFTTLEEARKHLGVDRPTFARLLEMFSRIPELREAVCQAPAGKYWLKTILPLEKRGVLDAVLEGRPSYPQIVGLYPGPSCMFRCHFCVRVTGARYPASSLDAGNAILASVIDEAPTDNPDLMYMSGGLEPLANPKLGDLVDRAASRGFRMSLYTNSFALTEKNLTRQPGLWKLATVRTSLYGLNDEEYEATTSTPKSFQRVKTNLSELLRMRAERQIPMRLGLSYLILPGRARRLLDLADFIIELSEPTPDRPIDFLDLRQDYSGRDDGNLGGSDLNELRDVLGIFEEKVQERLPTLRVDYGYALNSLRTGVETSMIRITPEQMRPRGHTQVSVQMDLLGDVYLYREAGFPELPGATRYIAGRVDGEHGLRQVVEDFVRSGRQISAMPGDEYFLDGFDQVITARLNQLEDDLANGWGPARGFLR